MPKFLEEKRNEKCFASGSTSCVEESSERSQAMEERKSGVTNEVFFTNETGMEKSAEENSTSKSREEATDNSEETLNKERRGQIKRLYDYWENLKVTIALPGCLLHPSVFRWLTLGLIGLAAWSVTYSIAGSEFLPGSQLFNLIILFVLAHVGGTLVKLLRLPSLLGMLLTGFLLRNVNFIHIEGVYTEIIAVLREIALCIILIRAGLGLDPNALKSLKFVILRLASIPGITEGVITMIFTHFLLGLPWVWGMLLGAILAAVSPAVVIPSLFHLQEKGYGTEKGIPTLVVAAASLDDILAITMFGVIINVIYSTGTSLTMQAVQGPLGIISGIAFGVIWGFAAHFVPHQKDGQVVLLRVLMILGGGLMAIIGSEALGYQGAGPLGCIITAFVASSGWKKQHRNEEHNSVKEAFRVIWLIFQPILFGLIGSEVDVSVLEVSVLGNGLIALICSLLSRIVITTFVAYGAKFNWREKTFIAWAWFPKATVQAALGPLALDIARRHGSDEEIIYARKILVLSVLAILITAPLGAAFIRILGPKLLSKVGEEIQHEQPELNEVSLESRSEEKNKTFTFTQHF